MNEINIISTGAPDGKEKSVRRRRRRRRGSRRADRIIAAAWIGLGFVLGFAAASILYLLVAMM